MRHLARHNSKWSLTEAKTAICLPVACAKTRSSSSFCTDQKHKTYVLCICELKKKWASLTLSGLRQQLMQCSYIAQHSCSLHVWQLYNLALSASTLQQPLKSTSGRLQTNPRSSTNSTFPCMEFRQTMVGSLMLKFAKWVWVCQISGSWRLTSNSSASSDSGAPYLMVFFIAYREWFRIAILYLRCELSWWHNR